MINLNLQLTTGFAILFAVFFLILSIRVITARRKYKVALGDEGRKELARRIRAQANFAEYVPFCLILMLLTELQHINPWFLLTVGSVLAIGRFFHAYGISQEPENFKLRTFGMACTFTCLVSMSVGLLTILIRF